jgi:uncharacterized protein
MSDTLVVRELPFPLAPSSAGVWQRDEQVAAVVAAAPARTDLYLDPGASPAAAASTLDAPTLLGTPPEGDFQLRARVKVGFQSTYNAGVLLLWADERNWAKLCFELSPAAEPMVVSVVTRGVSDDANAFVVPERAVWLRVSRVDRVYAFHASTDATTWRMVRVFSLGSSVSDHRVGFEAQAPTGEGCTVTFDDLDFTGHRLMDLRDGS